MKHWVDAFQGKRIAVWGDFILDEYVFTRAKRVSREAPVLITEFESEAYRLGGAGNVAANMSALGARPVPVGVMGCDNSGKVLSHLLETQGITSEFLVAVDDFTTPKKSRIMSGDSHTSRQQVLRIDRLNSEKLTTAITERLVEKLRLVILDCDFLVISDYLNLSATGPVLDILRTEIPLPPIALDSRRHLKDFHDIRVATPNENELHCLFPGNGFSQLSDFFTAGKQLQNEMNAKGMIMKRGDKGMIVLDGEKDAREIGIFGPREIVDVTGAGDTVIALLSLALSADADLYTAARIATVAAGLTVMKSGASVVNPQELSAALKRERLQ